MNYKMKTADLVDNHRSIEFLSVRYLAYFFIFFLSLSLYINSPEGSDLRVHTRIIEKLDEGHLGVPHFLYHLVVYGISKISHLSFHYASCLLLAICNIGSVVLIEQILRHFLRGKYSDYFLLFVSVALMFVSAIYSPLINKYPYKGIWTPNPWHNPTFTAAKPVVLLIFYLYVIGITKEQYFGKRFSLTCIALLLGICALIKPNFVLAFIPASIVFCFFLPGRRVSMLVKTVQLLLPVLAVLVFQFLFTYYYDVRGASSIQFCFFDVWKAHARSIPIAILQGTSLPLVILIMTLPRLPKDKALLFSWILFIVGLLIFGLLCETGHRKNHANFAWTYMSCLNILFVYSAIRFLRWASDAQEKNGSFQIKTFVCVSVFLFHFFSGIYYVAYLMSGHSY
ncbi:MAG: hypothetical protein OEV87_09255 [Phycisphaerae bacterium]|nr:hypothetical protein [Phycisphaerae bacterium]